MSIKLSNKYKRIIIICILIAAIFFVKNIFKKKPHIQARPRPVETALAIQEDVPIYIESFGNLYPPNNVNIQSQVTGEIKEIHFNEGDEVKAGDLLFVIDPAPYKAVLDKNRAALMEDLANLKLQKLTYDRNKKLFEKQLISQQDFDTYESDLASAEAKVRLDNAEIESAKINLDYCYIKAPVDGLTGKRQVDLGNIVSANTGPTLVNIKTIDTLYVDFTVTERRLDDIRNAMKNGKLKIEIYLEGNPDKTYSGNLELIDNSVDNTTGTILLRAAVSNKERSLWAGQFVTLRLILGMKNKVVLVPYEAVSLGQKGSYVFVITLENKADLRQVNTGQRHQGLIAIENGVSVGERVVTSGQMGLSPGVIVVDTTGVKEKK